MGTEIIIAILIFGNMYMFHSYTTWRERAYAQHDRYVELRANTDSMREQVKNLVDNYNIIYSTIEESFEVINDNIGKFDHLQEIMQVRNNMLSALQRCNSQIKVP